LFRYNIYSIVLNWNLSHAFSYNEKTVQYICSLLDQIVNLNLGCILLHIHLVYFLEAFLYKLSVDFSLYTLLV
jgi:hypothetical protein